MLPAEMALRPEVSPYLPEGPAPAARPREVVRVAAGDTLRLEAGLVERTLKGHTYTAYAFNGQYPGPLIEAVRGSEIVVAFTNRLREPTTVHWHGIRLDQRNDGVPDLSQPVVPPGGRFIYHLRFPDAGIYWYHPHVREDVQQELGLYGNLLVRQPERETYGAAHREAVLMLDDILIGDDGPVPLGAESPTHALMGRFGNLLLVNGEPSYRLRAGRGEVVRFYLTNAANTRSFNLSWPGARVKVVGSDVGSYAREEWVDNVVIGPAERYVVHVRFDRPGYGAAGQPGPRTRSSVRQVLRRGGYPRYRGGRVRRRRSPTCAESFATLRRDTAIGRGDGALSRRGVGRPRAGAGAHAGDERVCRP